MGYKKRRVAAKESRSQQQTQLTQLLMSAIAQHREGRLEQAERVYRAVLTEQPKHPDALHFFGVLLHQLGQSDKGIASIQQALAIVPDYLDALNNLGNVLKETGDMDGAAQAYRNVLALSPEHVAAHNNLGVALKNLKHYADSIQVLQKGLELSPHNPEILRNLGNSYQESGDYQQAVDTYRLAIAANPTQQGCYYSLWRVLFRQGQKQAAQQCLQDWLVVEPNNPIALHYFLSAKGENVPEKASEAYVQQTFDQFAATFDAVLDNLEYRAPTLVGQVVAALYADSVEKRVILDAGCGTGLCGDWLKPYAQRLVGVDLSAQMLNKARGRELYDELIAAELVDYLNRQFAVFDLIVSADTLVYFGKLDAAFAAAKQALKSGGVLVFTVEKQSGEQDFVLNYHGRYSHSEAYISSHLQAAGFNVQSLGTVILRKEAGEPVIGMLVSAVVAG